MEPPRSARAEAGGKHLGEHQGLAGEALRQVCNLLEAVPPEEMWNTVRNLQSYR